PALLGLRARWLHALDDTFHPLACVCAGRARRVAQLPLRHVACIAGPLSRSKRTGRGRAAPGAAALGGDAAPVPAEQTRPPPRLVPRTPGECARRALPRGSRGRAGRSRRHLVALPPRWPALRSGFFDIVVRMTEIERAAAGGLLRVVSTPAGRWLQRC